MDDYNDAHTYTGNCRYSQGMHRSACCAVGGGRCTCRPCSECKVMEERESKAALRCTLDAAQALKMARRRDVPIDFTIDAWECGPEDMRLVRLVDGSHRVEARRAGEDWRSVKDDCALLVSRIEQFRELLGLPPAARIETPKPDLAAGVPCRPDGE